MTKRTIVLVFVSFALAAAPAALAAGGRGPGSGTASARGGSVAQLRLTLLKREAAILRRCAKSTSEKKICTALATRLPAQIQKLDTRVQQRIATLQACSSSGSSSSGSTAGADPCANADKKIARLQRLDKRLQALATRLQSLAGGAPAPATTTTTTG